MYNLIKYSDFYSKTSGSLWQYYKDDSNDNLILTWSKDCVITNSEGEAKFARTEIKLYVPVVTSSRQDNAKLLQQLKSGFKRLINWNKYELLPKTYAQKIYLNQLINPSFQGVKRLFVLSFENEDQRKSHSAYYLPKV